MSIRVQKLRKRYDNYLAVDDVSFSVADGEFVTLLGPSGSGKSTILRCIAGLEQPTDGSIEIDGNLVTHIPVQKRKVGFVFQHYALFRHMTIQQNVEFGLSVRGMGKKDRDEKARELLNLVGLSGFEKRYPNQLSGGQRQRVALARALAPEPSLLLLDEPLSALDTRLRKGLRMWIRKLHDKIKLTSVMVTHDQEEAFELSDRILVVNEGKIEQSALPQKIFDEPASEFVASFVGETNQILAPVSRGSILWNGLKFSAPFFPDGEQVKVLFRPHDVYVTSQEEEGAVSATIKSIHFFGAFEELDIELGSGDLLTAHIPIGVAEKSAFHVGKKVFVQMTKYHIFMND